MRHHVRWQVYLSAALLAVGVGLTGCSTTVDATTPPGMKYSGGTLSAVVDAPFESVWRASFAALDATEVTVLDREKTMSGGSIDGLTPDLKTVRVSVRRLSETKSELRIRIDAFGNSELAHIIYDKFKIAVDPSK